MTLLDRCQDLRRQIDRRNVLRREDKEAEAVRERVRELKNTRESIDSTVKKVMVLITKGISVGKLPDVAVTVALLQELQQKLTDNAADGQNFGRLKRSIGKVDKDFIAMADKALDSVKRDLPSIEETFLKQVELIPAYQDRVARIRMARNALFSGVDLQVMDAEQLAQFLDRRDGLRGLADQLNPEEFPKEVLEFFRAARQAGGAPLGKLTETVNQWLAERDQLKNLRITITGQ